MRNGTATTSQLSTDQTDDHSMAALEDLENRVEALEADRADYSAVLAAIGMFPQQGHQTCTPESPDTRRR